MRSPVGIPSSLAAGHHPKPPRGIDEWDLLPPLNEIIEAVNTFTCHYFQLGFIPKQQFPEQLKANPRSVSVFFLLSILSVSARLTPCLIERFGSAVKASETFMERASSVALNELYRPTLENCQAFYLLSIAQQGSGMKDRHSVCPLFRLVLWFLGSAVSMYVCAVGYFLTRQKKDQHGYCYAHGHPDAAAS